MFFLKRLYVQFNHYMKNNLWYIIINEGTCVSEPCIYFRKEHIWCSHVKSLPGWSLCSTKHHRYWSVAALAWQLRNSKPVHILHCTHHKWQSIAGVAPEQGQWPFFVDKVTSVTEDSLEYLRKLVINASTMWVIQSSHTVSNWLK